MFVDDGFQPANATNDIIMTLTSAWVSDVKIVKVAHDLVLRCWCSIAVSKCNIATAKIARLDRPWHIQLT